MEHFSDELEITNEDNILTLKEFLAQKYKISKEDYPENHQKFYRLKIMLAVMILKIPMKKMLHYLFVQLK